MRGGRNGFTEYQATRLISQIDRLLESEIGKKYFSFLATGLGPKFIANPNKEYLPETYAASFTNLGSIYGIVIKGMFLSSDYDPIIALYDFIHETLRIQDVQTFPGKEGHNDRVFRIQHKIMTDLLNSGLLTKQEKSNL
ncbi:MAG: hypothetical protein HZY76_11955 [Anaerolineae bacterium]|nr:MAG: hypothetical protein HZY76_11955 [Anaerolineae bacterium]